MPTWAGPLPPDQLLAGCFALCLLSVSLLDHFSETKALHLTYNQVIVRFLSLPLMMMASTTHDFEKLMFSPILKIHT